MSRFSQVLPSSLMLIALTGIALVLLASLFAVRPAAQNEPKNIIILFADGAGSPQFELGRYSSWHLRNLPFAITDTVLKEGSLGLMTTHSAESIATDSAAAGTAMSTGVKTTIGTIAMTADGRVVPTVMEAAKARGKSIGLVTTERLYGATLAAFSVHASSRSDSQVLVDQYLLLEPDVMLGGGRDYFLPASTRRGKRTDGKDVTEAFRAKRYQIARDTDDLRTAKGPKLLGLFADLDMDLEIDRDPDKQPSVADMAQSAIRVLSQNSPNGFVLLVETENTDSAGHWNDTAALIRDLWVFDEAVQHALAFQRGSASETLLLVTGDHETGGLSITQAQRDPSRRSTGNHFYAAPVHLEMISRITISLEKAADTFKKSPSQETLDRVVAEHFPGFQLDPDLREAILGEEVMELAFIHPTENALARMVSRQTGFYWATSGHTAQPVIVGALGPRAERFRGYLDNTDFGRILHELISGSH